MEVLLRWYLTIILTSIVFSNLSTLISMRKLYFLAADAPHASLLATCIAIILTNTTKILSEYIWASLMGGLLMIIIGYAIYKGFNADIITSIYVAASSSLSVLLINYILVNYKLGYNIWSIILGDPLLVWWDEVFIILVIAIITPIIMLYTFKYQLYMGVDPDYVKMKLRYGWIYEFITFTLLGLSSTMLIRVTGFILQHVLILLPAIIAMNLSESARKTYILSLLISISSGVVGLQIALIMNVAPSGTIGLMLMTAYVVSLIKSKLQHA